MKAFLVLMPLFLAACSACATQQKLDLSPRGVCLSRVMGQSGPTHDGNMQNLTEAECVEEMQRHCANTARASKGVICQLFWRQTSPVAQPMSLAPESEPAEEEPEGRYDI